MKTIKTSIVGTTFRHKDDPSVKDIRPEGEVQLVCEKENKYDDRAVAVYWKEKKIGYIGREKEENEYNPQAMIREQWEDNIKLSAKIVECKYLEEKDWNNEGRGVFMGALIEITTEGRFYPVGDEQYISISTLLKEYPQSIDNVIRWAFSKASTYEEYEEILQEYSDNGTQRHEDMEKFLIDAEGHPFIDKYNPTVIDLEQRVDDHELKISGRYDAFVIIDGKRILIDWKSSKSVQKKHKTQVGWYAKMKEADEAWIVCLGAHNKQGYSVCKSVDIDKEYERVRLLKSLYNLDHE